MPLGVIWHNYVFLRACFKVREHVNSCLNWTIAIASLLQWWRRWLLLLASFSAILKLSHCLNEMNNQIPHKLKHVWISICTFWQFSFCSCKRDSNIRNIYKAHFYYKKVLLLKKWKMDFYYKNIWYFKQAWLKRICSEAKVSQAPSFFSAIFLLQELTTSTIKAT